ncbi:hypothetical protein H5J24_04940 [Chryseobacterium capnotolerans]|uniref:hypothetical protein n=1 Tax=Chryseobacterium TaxID=59732 RepID=UPI00083ADD8D|nr:MULTISPECIES: hypothetical protein [Chryseobacterium]UHO39449.1 hypothetical protein H5J24_04940 [Chryseobacterium capnotolerans]
MKNLAFLITLTTTFFCYHPAYAQKISDGQTLEVNGMDVTFNILNKESVESGGKQYDRYKVSASVKNKSDKAYNIRLSAFPQIVSNIGLVELDCVNATGARLTSKKIELKMKAQMLNVTYSAYDKSGKFTTSTIPVTGSYYFDPGDTISDNAIFIVPQGEKPDVSVRSLK